MQKYINREIKKIELIEQDNEISKIKVYFTEDGKKYVSNIYDIFVNIEKH